MNIESDTERNIATLHLNDLNEWDRFLQARWKMPLEWWKRYQRSERAQCQCHCRMDTGWTCLQSLVGDAASARKVSETDTSGYKRDSLSQPNDTDPYRPMIEDIETRQKGRYRMILDDIG